MLPCAQPIGSGAWHQVWTAGAGAPHPLRSRAPRQIPARAPLDSNAALTAGIRIAFLDRGEEVVIENFERLPMSVAMKETNVRVVAAR
ncbi:hypothetical protein ACN9MZ_26955 [Pseudoduganella sp. S-14]|uniref:hypothetical protein n=1 Tax=Pseudoduganella sp. S-14 TaxID=3404065 RepID=UPI003CE77973